MRIIGVTGSIGSGKSTVSEILKSYGALVLDADAIAHDITKESNVLEEIVNSFGPSILKSDGQLDRKKLAEIVFSDTLKLKVLNKITHKYVIERIIKEIDEIKVVGAADIIVLDVPIPVKHGFLDIVDEVWTVTADKDLRIERVMKRSGYTREEVIRRMNSQPSDEEYLKIADEIIENNAGLDELKKQIELLLNR